MRVRFTVTGGAKVPSALFRVGGQGKPVRIRRGPATVTGDATRTGAHALEPLDRRRRPGKARGGRPGSQETSPDRRLISPSRKGVASCQDVSWASGSRH